MNAQAVIHNFIVLVGLAVITFFVGGFTGLLVWYVEQFFRMFPREFTMFCENNPEFATPCRWVVAVGRILWCWVLPVIGMITVFQFLNQQP